MKQSRTGPSIPDLRGLRGLGLPGLGTAEMSDIYYFENGNQEH